MKASTLEGIDPIRMFSDHLKVTGVAHTNPEPDGDPDLIGKRLGLINGGAWVQMWSYYFGRKYLPGVHLLNVSNEAVQVNFMEAHQKGLATPPQSNIEAFARYAQELVVLGNVDAIMITCSTMNRSYPQVARAVDVPVMQIDRPMMEAAVNHGGRVLVVATHGPTVESTQALLRETATDLGKKVTFSGLNVESAWHRLAKGDLIGHNQELAEAIRSYPQIDSIGCVVLAQLSMTVFLLSYPDPVASFGAPVFTSGQCGFEYMRQVLVNRS
jgi:hypothetical protein